AKSGPSVRSHTQMLDRHGQIREPCAVRLLRLAIALVVIVALLGEVGYSLLLQTEFVAAAAARDPQAQNVSASIGFPLTPGLALHRTARVTVSEHQIALGPLKADALVARG